ncbi:unnamed protein product [Caenorhabditis brenneri]
MSLVLHKALPIEFQKGPLLLLETSGHIQENRESFEIDERDLIKSNSILGRGNFGEVFKWILRRDDILMEVAVKRCRIYTNEQRYLVAKELEIMCMLGRHPNIIGFMGAVTVNARSTLLVLEYADCRNLLDFLRVRRDIFKNQLLSDDLGALNTLDLVSYAFQIANGMKYLASIMCVHRDLALRNCLVTHNKTIRVADFGLAREQKNEYYRMRTDPGLPYNWMPIESMKDFDANIMTKFNEKTDVWSFGVCLYELFTLGDRPYENVDNVSKFLDSGKRLSEPEYCPTEIYELMEKCWDRDPLLRPNFAMCAEMLKDQLRGLSEQAYHELQNKLGEVAEEQEKLECIIRK